MNRPTKARLERDMKALAKILVQMLTREAGCVTLGIHGFTTATCLRWSKEDEVTFEIVDRKDATKYTVQFMLAIQVSGISDVKPLPQ